MKTREQLTTAQAAAAAGVTRKAIRIYEQRGLITPVTRTATGYRQFTGADVKLLAFIRSARTLGLTLADIETILRLQRAGTALCAAVTNLIDLRIAQIDHTIAGLQQLRKALAAIREHRPSATAHAEICPIIEH